MVTPAVLLVGASVTFLLVRTAHTGPARRRGARLAAARPGWLPVPIRRVLARTLESLGVEVSPDDAATGAAGAVASVGIVVAGLAPELLPAVMVAGAVAVACGAGALRRRAAQRFVAALPLLLDDVVAQLHAGATVTTAVLSAPGAPGPLAADLTRLRTRVDLGADLVGALRRWTGERAIPELRVVAGGLALAVETGGPAAEALDGLARSVRDQLGAQADATALAAQARLSAVVVGSAPVAYLVFSSLIDGNAAESLGGSPAGRVCLVVGLLLEVLGVVWMRRIVGSQP